MSAAAASPCTDESLLFDEGAGAAEPADRHLQDLLQGLVHVSQALQVHTVPQRVIQPGRTHSLLLERRTQSILDFYRILADL